MRIKPALTGGEAGFVLARYNLLEIIPGFVIDQGHFGLKLQQRQ